MKIHKMICLDHEIVEELKLKGINVSATCNELLRNHLNEMRPRTIEERQKRVKALEIQLEAMNKIEELDNGKR